MELSIIERILSLGVGGVLGVIIFMMYRKDKKEAEKRWCDLLEELIDVRKDENLTKERNTMATSELVTLIKKLNGRLGKIMDDLGEEANRKGWKE